MKKLLILGGSKYIIPVIKKSHEFGYFVITCDYLPNNYAHSFADKYLNISILDKDAVLAASKKEKIDGIISFACDPGVVTAAYVAEKMGLPSVGPFDSVCILQNKNLFRSFLKNNNFNVPFFKKYSTAEDAFIDSDHFDYPIIVKPTDSAGSKGVSKVDNKEQLKSAVFDAFSISNKKEIIIEEFIEYLGHPSDADSFFSNGKLLYFGLNSQLFDSNATNPYTPAAYSWPSTFSREDISILKHDLEKLFNLLRMRTAIFNIEVRKSTNGKLFIMEASPRGGGNRLTEMAQFGTKQDLLGPYLKYSVGEIQQFSIRQLEFDKYWCEIILHSRKNGVFYGVQLSDCVSHSIVEKDIWVKEGENVSSFTGANQTIGTLILKFKTSEEMNNLLKDIDGNIKVIVK